MKAAAEPVMLRPLSFSSAVVTAACFTLMACAGSPDPDSGDRSHEPAGGASGASTAPPPGGTSAGTGNAPVSGGSAGATTLGGQANAGNANGGAGAGTGGTNTSGGAGGSGAGHGGDDGAGGDDGSGGEPATDDAPIDYSIWSLQLPIGSGTSPTTISPMQLLAGFSNEYFYAGDDGGQIFMDPATGITTSGSQHCRSEMREMSPGGGGAAWPSTGTNTMTVTGKVLKVGGGSSGTVTVGQVFNGTDSIPLCELEYSTSLGGFKLLYEEAKGGGMTTNLETPVALNERYEFELALNDGKLFVSINGKQVYTRTPSPAIAAKRFYFKFGNYDQTAKSGPISSEPYTLVEVYTVKVVHP
jgi:hypothetical protein